MNKCHYFSELYSNFLLLILGNRKLETPSQMKVDYISSEAPDDYKTLSDYLDQQKEKYTLIMRYPLASYQFLNFAKKYGTNIFVEHNTLEENELLLQVKKYNFRDLFYLARKLNLKEFFQTKKLLKTESKIGAEILSYLRGGICVTNEIAAYETSRCENYVTFVSSNPIPHHVNTPAVQSKLMTHPFKVVFISGGGFVWHGLERWLLSMKQYPDKKAIHLFVVGKVTPENRSLIKKMQLDGYLIEEIAHVPSTDLPTFFADKHLGIGSLGLHKMNMSEASTLKTREYLANGLPVIIGYKDTDFSDQKFSNFVYHVPNNDELFEIQAIIDWLTVFYSDPRQLTYLFDQLPNYTYLTKISSLIQFINDQTKK